MCKVMEKGWYVMFACVISVLVIGVVPALDADSDGCWSGLRDNRSCLEYSTYVKNNKIYFELTNVYKDRLYVKWCGNDRCRSSGLRGGQTTTQYEFVTNATTTAKAIGSIKPLND
ncbi:hypothetical protein NKDENANG_03724 [Candidatus Entotheonellaceae bacterium PAL068K]